MNDMQITKEAILEFKDYTVKKSIVKIIGIAILASVPFLFKIPNWISTDTAFALSSPFMAWACMALYGALRVVLSEPYEIRQGTVKSVYGHGKCAACIELSNGVEKIGKCSTKTYKELRCNDKVNMFKLKVKI